MAIGNHITLVKSVPNIPWYNALGILQNLNPAILQSMASTPAKQWAERGLLIPFKVKQITKHNVGARPLATVGFTNWSAQGITVDSSNNINRQGAVINGPQYQTAQANVVGTVQALGAFFQSVFWTVNIYEDNTTRELFVGMSRDYTNPWTDLTIRQLRVDTGAEANLSFNNATREPNNGNRSVGGSSVGTAFQPVDIFYGGILFSACSFDFELSCKLFKNYNGLKEYQATGSTENEIGGEPAPETPAEDRKTTLFFNSTIYRKRDGQAGEEKVGASSVQFIVQYKSNDGTEKIPAERQVAGYVNNYAPINQNTWGNIVWKKSKDAKLVQVKARWTDSAGVSHELVYQPLNYPFGVKLYGFYGNWRDGDYLYYSKYGTNMMIYANEADLDRYQEGDPTVKPLVDGHIGRFQPEEIIGDPTVYNSQSYELVNDMSSVWVLTQSQLDDLASVFSTGLLRDEALEDGVVANVTKTAFRSFLAHGEPIDAVCDLFWVPIDPLDFVDSHSDTMEFAVDRYGVLETVAEISDTFGERYSVSKSIGYNIALGPGASAVNNLKKIADSFESVVGPKDEETENVIHQGQYHNSQSSIQ